MYGAKRAIPTSTEGKMAHLINDRYTSREYYSLQDSAVVKIENKSSNIFKYL